MSNESRQLIVAIAELFLEGLLVFLGILNGMLPKFNHTGSRIVMYM